MIYKKNNAESCLLNKYDHYLAGGRGIFDQIQHWWSRLVLVQTAHFENVKINWKIVQCLKHLVLLSNVAVLKQQLTSQLFSNFSNQWAAYDDDLEKINWMLCSKMMVTKKSFSWTMEPKKLWFLTLIWTLTTILWEFFVDFVIKWGRSMMLLTEGSPHHSICSQTISRSNAFHLHFYLPWTYLK